MLLSKVYSNVLFSSIHIVLQNTNAFSWETYALQVLVALSGETASRLSSHLGGKHSREGSPCLSICMCLALFKDTFPGAQALESWTQLFVWESQPLMQFTKDGVSGVHFDQTLKQRGNFSSAVLRHRWYQRLKFIIQKIFI